MSTETDNTRRSSREIGSAKIVSEASMSDGTTALEILNFRKTKGGTLESRFRIAPLINTYYSTGVPNPDQPFVFWLVDGVLGMGYMLYNGTIPELLFLTASGAYRYTPWLHAQSALSPMIERQEFYRDNGDTASASIQGSPLSGASYFPPQIEVLGNRMYFTHCDGGQAWVWDRDRLRPFGYYRPPSSPDVCGPTEGDDENDGGFSARGRIGTLESDWTINDPQVVVGGLDEGEWDYYVVFEGVDGAYSETSPRGGTATVRKQVCSVDELPEALRRRWRVQNIPSGPEGTSARILLRTANKRRLPDGDSGRPRFLHRIPGNRSQEWVDDIPDSELGATWQERMSVPGGFYLLRGFAGSLFLARTEDSPSRVWWSEQGGQSGPTPESFLAGHWRDVYPNTGPITALHSVYDNSGSGNPTLLVFKDGACHFMSGQFPDWNIGTISDYAGCSGPGCVQSIPDGSVIWYGGRTFWRMGRDGSISDIGSPIRTRLERVNASMARKGVSFVKRETSEVFFCLPTGESTDNNYQFIWDWELGGWRFGDQMSIRATATIRESDMVIVSGDYNGANGVWLWDHGIYGQEVLDVGADPESFPTFGLNPSVYQTGWVPLDDGVMKNAYNVTSAVVTGRHAYEGRATVAAYRHWDARASTITEVGALSLASPQDDTIPYWNDSADADAAPDTPATLDESLYSDQTPYFCRVAVDASDTEVISMKLTVPAGEVLDLVGITAFATRQGSAGHRAERVPEVE